MKLLLQSLLHCEGIVYLLVNAVQVSPRDKGEYMCEATNSVDTDYISIYIHINYLPRVQPLQSRIYSGVGAKEGFKTLIRDPHFTGLSTLT